jgi:hypothetical protein
VESEQERKRWQELAKLIVEEQDPAKLNALIREIDEILVKRAKQVGKESK